VRQAQRPLSPVWVAGSVRARGMLTRAIGTAQARAVASSPSLPDAIAILVGSSYGRFVRPGMDLGEAQRAVAQTALWHTRVLAGWTPPGALEPVRALAAWFELVNIEDRLAYLAGAPAPTPFELGGLAIAWRRAAGAQSATEIREALRGSRWGVPSSEDRVTVGLHLRLAWARWVLEAVPEAAEWAAGAVGLLLARQRFLSGRAATELAAQRPPGVGMDWTRASDLPALRRLLPAEAAWPLAGVDSPGELWRGEVAWWRRVEAEATLLARDPNLGRPAICGCLALLGVDARRTAAALGSTARDAKGAFDELA
jgi:hypothetical protein